MKDRDETIVWLQEYYSKIDSLDMDKFLEYLSPEIEVQFGNNPIAKGKAQVKENISNFWSTINGMKHTTRNIYIDNNTIIYEALVTYLKNNKEISVPVVTIINKPNELVDSLKIFIDLAPLFHD